jgi:hypothetical protein
MGGLSSTSVDLYQFLSVSRGTRVVLGGQVFAIARSLVLVLPNFRSGTRRLALLFSLRGSELPDLGVAYAAVTLFRRGEDVPVDSQLHNFSNRYAGFGLPHVVNDTRLRAATTRQCDAKN